MRPCPEGGRPGFDEAPEEPEGLRFHLQKQVISMDSGGHLLLPK